ncbi:chitinase 2-like [Euphorbia lathyris]|uniref:chitinase 2-like n=1 Tax=Euphorbia lathyris TaxID=212925 RepID=UPI003313F647
MLTYHFFSNPRMEIFSKFLISFLILQTLFSITQSANSNLFREYIGANFNNVKFSDVPINPNVEFHFILTFAVDYHKSNTSSPTNGKFNVFWDSKNLSPSEVTAIKAKHPNVKVALSIGGTGLQGRFVYFQPSSVKSWVSNAVSSLTRIIKKYNLDGIDIDYQHFPIEIESFAECMGQLVTTLKKNGVISFASIAPFDNDLVQWPYKGLWRKYGNLIDYVNFQFYAYDQRITVSQFLEYFNFQSSYYNGSKVLVSLVSDESGGLTPANGFFSACKKLKRKKKLHGIFIWSADFSKDKANGFRYEKQAQALLATRH